MTAPYSPGGTPTMRLKCLVKWLWSAKPTASAVSMHGNPRRNRCFACTDACLYLIGMRRQAYLIAKRAEQVKRTEMSNRGQLFERDVLSVVFLEIGADALNAQMLFGERTRTWMIVGIAYDEAGEGP